MFVYSSSVQIILLYVLQIKDGESTIRPSQLVQRTVSGGEANEATLPSWQMALREKNKTKRASMGETQRNPSLTSPVRTI